MKAATIQEWDRAVTNLLLRSLNIIVTVIIQHECMYGAWSYLSLTDVIAMVGVVVGCGTTGAPGHWSR